MTATDTAMTLARVAAQAAADKLAKDILLVDVSDRLALTDVFVIVTGANERQVGAIVDSVEEKMRAAGTRPPRREGERDGRWVLLDFIDVVVHVQHSEERVFYALDRLWKDCPTVPFVDSALDPGSAASAGAVPSSEMASSGIGDETASSGIGDETASSGIESDLVDLLGDDTELLDTEVARLEPTSSELLDGESDKSGIDDPEPADDELLVDVSIDDANMGDIARGDTAFAGAEPDDTDHGDTPVGDAELNEVDRSDTTVASAELDDAADGTQPIGESTATDDPGAARPGVVASP